MFGKINDLTEKFRNNKIFYGVLAVLISLFLWVYVAQSQNPQEERLFEIPLEYNNLPAHMAVVDKVETVKVRVQGYSAVLENLDTKDITASLDLSDANIGQYVAKINIELPQGVQLISVTPVDVEVNIQELASVEVPVEVDYSEVSPDSGCQLLTPITMTDAVQVSGAKSIVAKIGKAVVKIAPCTLAESYSGTLPVIIYDSYGNSMEDLVTVTPQTVDVMLPVIGDSPSKVAPISANLVGEPAEGYAVSRIVISPNIVTAYGSQNLLDAIDYIYTESIDIEGAKTDVGVTVGLISDDGIRLDNEEQVSVLVKIEKATSKTFDNVQIKLAGSNSSYKYILSKDVVSAVVNGPESVLAALSANNVSVTADVAGLKPGSYTIKLNCSTPGSSYVESIYPDTITVLIK